jgi:hypothetical protein
MNFEELERKVNFLEFTSRNFDAEVTEKLTDSHPYGMLTLYLQGFESLIDELREPWFEGLGNGIRNVKGSLSSLERLNITESILKELE